MFFQQIHIDHPLTDQQKGKELVLDVSMKLDLPATDIQFGYHSAEYFVKIRFDTEHRFLLVMKLFDKNTHFEEIWQVVSKIF